MRVDRTSSDPWPIEGEHGTQRAREPFEAAQAAQPRTPPRRPARAGRAPRAAGAQGAAASAAAETALAQTAGNVEILQHLIDTVLPRLALPADVRALAAALLSEDMDHHRRVLSAESDPEEEASPA